MSKLLKICLAAALGVLLVVLWRKPSKPTYQGTVFARIVEMKGLVTVNAELAQLAQPLKKGDQVEVPLKAWARIEFFDSSTMLVTWNEVDKRPGQFLVDKHESSSGTMFVNLIEGAVAFLVPKARCYSDEYRIQAKNTVTAIEGTQGVVRSSSVGDQVALRNGRVGVSSRTTSRTVSIGPSECTSCCLAVGPCDPERWSWQDFVSTTELFPGLNLDAMEVKPVLPQGVESKWMFGSAAGGWIGSHKRLLIKYEAVLGPFYEPLKNLYQVHPYAVWLLGLAMLIPLFQFSAFVRCNASGLLAVGLEVGAEASRVWVSVADVQIPAGAFVLSLLILVWIIKIHHNFSDAIPEPGTLWPAHVGRGILVWILGLTMGYGPSILAFWAPSHGFLSLDCFILSVTPEWSLQPIATPAAHPYFWESVAFLLPLGLWFAVHGGVRARGTRKAPSDAA